VAIFSFKQFDEKERRWIVGAIVLVALTIAIYFLMMAIGTFMSTAHAATIEQMLREEIQNDTIPAFRIAHDSFRLADDKLAHFGAYFAGATLMHEAGARDAQTIALLTTLNVLWELKDAVVPWETNGPVGGDGLSFPDAAYSELGLLLALLILD
jgi:hypothetical protein